MDDEDEYYDEPYEPDDEGECEAFGGTGCLYLGCTDWGGDGLCFAQMRLGYGRL